MRTTPICCLLLNLAVILASGALLQWFHLNRDSRDDPAYDAFHQRGHLSQRSVAMPRGQRPWDLSGLVAFAPALICVPGGRHRLVPLTVLLPRRGASPKLMVWSVASSPTGYKR